MNTKWKIILQTAAKLDGKIPYDNFFCMMNSHLIGLVDSHFIYQCFDQYRNDKRKRGEWPPAVTRAI
ncbi:MAG TPA: hypothetical protein VH796_09275 [Nitrososphaeraceae archaeon]|jgi:hypothetical protein